VSLQQHTQQRKRSVLNRVDMNNNFCHHPWVGLDIQNDGELRPCCKFKPDLENWKKFYIQDGIENYNNSYEISELKKQFLNGKKPAGCMRCWKDEDAGYPSKRQLDYSNFPAELDNHDLESQDNFLFLTIPIGNFCNLKCRICSPSASTTWIKEWNDLFGEKRTTQDWHKNSTVWQDVLKYSENSLEIHILGGEPFLYDTKEHFELLDHLIDSNSSKKIKIHYNTNGTIFPHSEYWEKWKKFKWVDIQLSIDDMGRRFEYNRHPANWNVVKKNLFKYRDNIAVSNNLQLSISTTVSAFTIFYLEEFFDFMHANSIPKPWLGRLQRPYYYRASVFPADVKQLIREKLKNSKYEDLRKIISWVDDNDSEHWNTFLKYAEIHDKYRKENFQQTFPEIYNMLSSDDK
jgi:MoaA/NifB/PqqE/SkfB family radical SAM enzyme